MRRWVRLHLLRESIRSAVEIFHLYAAIGKQVLGIVARDYSVARDCATRSQELSRETSQCSSPHCEASKRDFPSSQGGDSEGKTNNNRRGGCLDYQDIG